MGELILTFEWDGTTVHKETKGFKGKSCTEVTKFIDKALGGETSNRKLKPEYYEDGGKQKQTNKY